MSGRRLCQNVLRISCFVSTDCNLKRGRIKQQLEQKGRKHNEIVITWKHEETKADLRLAT